MVKSSKPAPDIFLLACEKIGASPAETYIIEDSYNGVRAAHAAGAKVIMVPDIVMPDEEMRALADYIFPSLREVQEFFAKGARA
jgi:beta-phosphoglucomutase-like phosphatase (HAD superfamily)